jgi:hypothetical protein
MTTESVNQTLYRRAQVYRQHRMKQKNIRTKNKGMPWTADQQTGATAKVAAFEAEYATAIAAWQNNVQAGSQGQYEAQVQDILRRWRQFTSDLQEQSSMALADQGVMDMLGVMVAEVEEQKQILERLRSEAGTRGDQADSLNPKVRPSPYTNILGLQRTFRSGTRTGILIASIVIGALALAALSFLVYTVLTRQSASSALESATRTPGLMGGSLRR